MVRSVRIKKDHLCIAAVILFLVFGLLAAFTSNSTGAVVKTCHTNANGNWDFCSAECKCGLYQGDCDSNLDCDIGLKCVDNFGPVVGLDGWTDVCADYETYLAYKESVVEESKVIAL